MVTVVAQRLTYTNLLIYTQLQTVDKWYTSLRERQWGGRPGLWASVNPTQRDFITESGCGIKQRTRWQGNDTLPQQDEDGTASRGTLRTFTGAE